MGRICGKNSQSIDAGQAARQIVTLVRRSTCPLHSFVTIQEKANAE